MKRRVANATGGFEKYEDDDPSSSSSSSDPSELCSCSDCGDDLEWDARTRETKCWWLQNERTGNLEAICDDCSKKYERVRHNSNNKNKKDLFVAYAKSNVNENLAPRIVISHSMDEMVRLKQRYPHEYSYSVLLRGRWQCFGNYIETAIRVGNTSDSSKLRDLCLFDEQILQYIWHQTHERHLRVYLSPKAHVDVDTSQCKTFDEFYCAVLQPAAVAGQKRWFCTVAGDRKNTSQIPYEEMAGVYFNPRCYLNWTDNPAELQQSRKVCFLRKTN